MSDEGDGIAPAKLGEIFEAFQRGDVQGQWGAGLGLAIASEGAKLLGAEFTVDSTVGIGSIFGLNFAQASPAAAAPPNGNQGIGTA